MTDDKQNKLIDKQDCNNLAILIAIALAIGVYLIVTTVLISKDGVFYIERAQKFLDDPVAIAKAHESGPSYPFLIMAAHKTISFVTHNNSNQAWIYSAQSITLLCRLLALAALYLMGKLMVGARQSFWAIMVLIILPYPAIMGSDVLREWPNLLCLAWGLLALLYGAKSGKWWLFGVAGVVAGFGHMVRPECVQIVLYGLAWLAFRFWRPVADFTRKRCVLAMLVMVIGVGVIVVPYAKVRGRLLPPKLNKLVMFDSTVGTEEGAEAGQICIAGFAGDRYLKGMAKLADRICQHLMYFFVPAVAIGFWLRFKKEGDADSIERSIMLGLTGLYLLMMLLLFRDYDYISRRHCMPLVIFTIFYLPAGIKAIAKWLCSITKSHGKSDVKRTMVILFVIGVGICLPKLLGNKDNKAGYIAAANWINANTAEDVVIASKYPRIGFYAERVGKRIKKPKDRLEGDYHLVIVEGDAVGGVMSFWVDQERKKKRIIVFRNTQK